MRDQGTWHSLTSVFSHNSQESDGLCETHREEERKVEAGVSIIQSPWEKCMAQLVGNTINSSYENYIEENMQILAEGICW